MNNFNLIVDGGNGSVKAVLVNNDTLLETVVIPSLLRFTPDCDFVRGGGKLTLETGESSFVLGWDNESRGSAIVIGNDSEGKLKYLPQILGGAVSAFVHHLPVSSSLAVHVMTLNMSQKPLIEKAVESLGSLVVDGVALKLKPRLANVLPEGFGCSSFAAKSFTGESDVVVFDLGSGTANLSTYYVGNSATFPRRQSFEFQPTGIRQLEDFLVEELRATTSNGRVDRKLMRHAIISNTYRLLTSFEGTDIKPHLERAIEQWLATPEMKALLNQVVFKLQTGVAVCVCGGGWKINAVKEAIELLLLSNAPSNAKWLVPVESHLLGALGIAHILIDEAKNKPVRVKKTKETSDNGTEQRTSEGTETNHGANLAGQRN